MDDLSIGNEVTMRPGAGTALGRIDQYELLRELGGGGFGTVFLARDTVAGIDVAVKGLPPLVKNNREELENIRRNFALVSRLHHPHIAAALVLHPVKSAIYSERSIAEKLRVFEGDTLMVMEYAPGVTLSQWRKQFPDGRVPRDMALAIVRQIADALDYAHAEKIIHRDVKPANVMIETRGAVEKVGGGGEKKVKVEGGGGERCEVVARVLDFGLAAEVRSSMGRVSQQVTDTSGTRPYMAPEQWLGKKQNAATDQYALAVLAYELLTGEVPFASVFETGDPVIMMNVVGREMPEISKDLPHAMRQAFAMALAKDPTRRFGSCAAFVAALSGRTRTPSAPRWIAIGAVALLAIAGVGGYVAWQRHEAEIARQMEAVRQAELARQAEAKRQADALAKSEAKVKAAAEAAAEAKRIAEEKAAEEKRLAEEKTAAEAKAKAEAEARVAEEKRLREAKEAAEKQEAKAKRKAEEAKAVETARQKAEESERTRKEAERKAEEERKIAEKRAAAEAVRKAAEERAANTENAVAAFESGHWGEGLSLAEKGAAEDRRLIYYQAVCLENGYVGKADEQKAFLKYLAAAEKGHAESQFKVGLLYSLGRVATKNPKLAVTWCKKAAEHGVVRAMMFMALACERGEGTEKDLNAAEQWYEMAAHAGNAKAKERLATLRIKPAVREPTLASAQEVIRKAIRAMIDNDWETFHAVARRSTGEEWKLDEFRKMVGRDTEKDRKEAEEMWSTFRAVMVVEKEDGFWKIPYGCKSNGKDSLGSLMVKYFGDELKVIVK